MRKWFAEALAKQGIKSRMDEAYQAELASLRAGAALETVGGDD